MTPIEIGRLLRASTTGFVAGCRVSQLTVPAFGALVRAPLEEEYQVYGLIYDIHIEDDGLVRQLVTAEAISDEVMRDNRERRIVPVEMSVLAVGYEKSGQIFHLLPPRPPLSLDVLFSCSPAELERFVKAGRFGYFRHILNAKDVPLSEVLGAHIQQVRQVTQDQAWADAALHELIRLLRDEYAVLMSVLGALSDAL
ncbi:MAG: HAS-barrel domain-containing protein [Anaerolineales bacterium]